MSSIRVLIWLFVVRYYEINQLGEEEHSLVIWLFFFFWLFLLAWTIASTDPGMDALVHVSNWWGAMCSKSPVLVRLRKVHNPNPGWRPAAWPSPAWRAYELSRLRRHARLVCGCQSAEVGLSVASQAQHIGSCFGVMRSCDSQRSPRGTYFEGLSAKRSGYLVHSPVTRVLEGSGMYYTGACCTFPSGRCCVEVVLDTLWTARCSVMYVTVRVVGWLQWDERAEGQQCVVLLVAEWHSKGMLVLL